MRLIDAFALPIVTECCVDEAGFFAKFKVVHEDDIKNAPTIEAVEVVRCKDCAKCESKVGGGYLCSRRAYKWNGLMCGAVEMKADDFCSYGVKKEVQNEAD